MFETFFKMKSDKLLSDLIFQCFLVLTALCWTASAQVDEDESNDVHELPAIGKLKVCIKNC